ncbi:MAG: hypothetical protein AMJ90_07120 [candidate division Zixibacteria bacterium SM23_73_2]|nr:MAG: hypothetical protein AMJ90_07120 [candidate division Zixibacteria bacterium SM23_73_2]
MPFWVYILKSRTEDRYYIGSTQNLKKRLEEHNSKKKRWTSRFQPWEIMYSEAFSNRGEAVKRERMLKSKEGIKEKLQIIEKSNQVEHP